METNLDYGFYEIWHGFLGLYDDYLISKSRVFIEWYPKLRFLEIKVKPTRNKIIMEFSLCCWIHG